MKVKKVITNKEFSFKRTNKTWNFLSNYKINLHDYNGNGYKKHI